MKPITSIIGLEFIPGATVALKKDQEPVGKLLDIWCFHNKGPIAVVQLPNGKRGNWDLSLLLVVEQSDKKEE
jgi:hypothetical protein